MRLKIIQVIYAALVRLLEVNDNEKLCHSSPSSLVHRDTAYKFSLHLRLIQDVI